MSFIIRFQRISKDGRGWAIENSNYPSNLLNVLIPSDDFNYQGCKIIDINTMNIGKLPIVYI
ncbi:hypothetical protein [Chryseobacterium indoltheticum]|uniref:Uncharacterized protein n=1 Tax=Chryseobacterium indoltheticum TaxID=254 RepID=A0A381FD02_9FLAO|nr:hypothetical protein [Chryseobacterium indoltheticum]SUX43962.1 Uncharacterised protein [Chryseobacterium indoltheticum]